MTGRRRDGGGDHGAEGKGGGDLWRWAKEAGGWWEDRRETERMRRETEQVAVGPMGGGWGFLFYMSKLITFDGCKLKISDGPEVISVTGDGPSPVTGCNSLARHK